MSVLFTNDNQWITPHVNHTISTYHYSTDLPTAVYDIKGSLISFSIDDKLWKSLSFEFISDIMTSLNDNSKCDQKRKSSYTYTCNDYFTFIVVPIYKKKNILGFMIAGPLCHSKDDHLKAMSSSANKTLKSFLNVKDTTKIFYLSQTMQHILDKAIYIGPHSSEPNRAFITKEEMKKRGNLDTPFKVIENIVDSVMSNNTEQAIRQYKQSLMFGDMMEEAILDNHNQLKANLLSLMTLLYYRINSEHNHSPYLEHFKAKFTHRIMNNRTYEDMFSCGECIIKNFSSLITDVKLSQKSVIVKKALTYIHENYSQKIKIDDICNSIYVSKAHLSATFKSEVGLSIMNYVKKYRIDQGKYLLSNTNKSILDISLDVGFDNQNYFSNVFKEITHESPRKYRQSKMS
ncbi:helix-turn-helix domain-containing protein [Acidaminobacter sp. JC074]|uniref:helix-turn-helix transcriptional regulator n=1 Tax=Acidaminobacter sp. JC074 TaxID=2530199 RepID=UPI001F0D4818|nr:helix-turn-helix domain-containing protein [Acidaminobacter sp. JC074]MCH4891045.1 helix-turn-helix domain-containing protein [Acidaminobacter sp. JC074]